jgi:hypothetical protein
MQRLGFPKKLVKLCRILNNEIYAKVKIGKHSSSEFKVKKRFENRRCDCSFAV